MLLLRLLVHWMTWQGHLRSGCLTFIWDADIFSIMELWRQMSRIIIPLLKPFIVQWTSSNIRLHSWRRNWKILSVEKSHLTTCIPFLKITSKGMVRNSGENIALDFFNIILCFALDITYILKPVGSFVGPCSIILQIERLSVTKHTGHTRINLTESKATTTTKKTYFKQNECSTRNDIFCNDSKVETLFYIKQLISFGSAE